MFSKGGNRLPGEERPGMVLENYPEGKMFTKNMFVAGAILVVSLLLLWTGLVMRDTDFYRAYPKTLYSMLILGSIGILVGAVAALAEAYTAYQQQAAMPAILGRLSPTEREDVLSRLAIQLHWAYEDEIKLQSGRMPIGGDPNIITGEYDQRVVDKYRLLRREKEQGVRQAIEKRYAEFWGAHNLYREIGYPVKKSHKEYLPNPLPARS